MTKKIEVPDGVTVPEPDFLIDERVNLAVSNRRNWEAVKLRIEMDVLMGIGRPITRRKND